MRHFKLLFIIFLIIIVFPSCSKSNELAGNWETIELSVNNVSLPVFESNIKFLQAKSPSTFTAKGCSGVNLYNADIKVKGKNFTASNMSNTGFMGNSAEMDFEDKFFETLMNSNQFEITNDELLIFSKKTNLKIRLKKSH